MKSDTAPKRKLLELEVFSGISILFIVLIHSNAYYLLKVLNFQSYEDAHFYIRLLDNFIHGAVQMFIFIAGYKYALNNIDENYKEYVLKKIKSVIKPFFILSFIFFMKNVISYPEYYNNMKVVIVEWIQIFRGYNLVYQFWYIPMYLFITCTYPILYKKCKSDKVRILVILLLVLSQYLLSIKIHLFSTFPFSFIYYYLFFEMGLFFYKYNIRNKVEKYFIPIMLIYILSVIILTINPVPNLYTVFQSYILYPMCIVFYYLISLKLKNNKLFQYLGRYSFYIFVLHEPIICTEISNKFNLMGIYNSMSYVFIVCVLTLICTIILSKIIENTFIKDILFSKVR